MRVIIAIMCAWSACSIFIGLILAMNFRGQKREMDFDRESKEYTKSTIRSV